LFIARRVGIQMRHRHITDASSPGPQAARGAESNRNIRRRMVRDGIPDLERNAFAARSGKSQSATSASRAARIKPLK
jgi:hypothetical protein